MTEDEMVGQHHRLDRHEFEQAPGFGDGQVSLACCSPWGQKESETTERKAEYGSIPKQQNRDSFQLKQHNISNSMATVKQAISSTGMYVK